MTGKQADALAAIVGGESWQSGGGVHLVTLTRKDGRVIVFDGECVCEYASDDDFDAGRAAARIDLFAAGDWGAASVSCGDASDRWVIPGPSGRTIYQHDALELGWADRGRLARDRSGLRLAGRPAGD